jgi:hypothetical protein
MKYCGRDESQVPERSLWELLENVHRSILGVSCRRGLCDFFSVLRRLLY